MKKLTIQQLEISGIKYYKAELEDLKKKEILYALTFADVEQGMDKATENIHKILKNKGLLK